MFSFSGIIVHMTWPLDHLTTTPVDSHTLIPGLFSFDVVYSQDAYWCYYCMMRCSQYSLLYGSIHWCTYNSRMVCYDIVCFNLCGVWQWVLHSCSSCHVTGSYSVSYLSTYYVVEYYSDRYNCGFLGWARCYRSQNRLACICICKLGCVVCAWVILLYTCKHILWCIQVIIHVHAVSNRIQSFPTKKVVCWGNTAFLLH